MSRKFSSLQDIYDFYQDGGTLASLTNLTQQDLNIFILMPIQHINLVML